MVQAISSAGAETAQRARLIYSQAQSELAGRLWQAALGTRGQGFSGVGTPVGDTSDMALDSFLALVSNARQSAQGLASTQPPSAVVAAPPLPQASVEPDDHPSRGQKRGSHGHRDASPGGGAARTAGLGPNAAYADTLNDAAVRTAIPASVLGAIVNAEAARDGEGRWLSYSRNPRSSAAGLGQFLSGTWIHEAERPGTWLNSLASENGWLDKHGHVLREARSALLERRYDGATSIHAIADYARMNLDQLGQRGVSIGSDPAQIARAAYLGHHLGLGDAARFLQGGLSEERAQRLLNAQIGRSAANHRIAAAGGSAAGAHRAWLLRYVDTNLRPMMVPSTRTMG